VARAGSAPVRVAIVDDHRLLAQSLALALHAAGYDAVLIDPLDDVVQRAHQWRVDVVLLDLDFGGTTGDGLVEPLSKFTPVVVVTAESDRARWGDCLLAGAVGVLSKAVAVEEIVAAVGDALEGRPVVAEADRITWLRESERARREGERRLAPFRRLTPREQEVLAAMVEGEAAAAIASRAVVSEATVRSQIRAVLTKLGVASQLQAVAAARRAGWNQRRG
jgi:DNA-binding NarL/FixJ family response regulator